MTDFNPGGKRLYQKFQCLAIESAKEPLTIDDALQRISTGGNGYGVPLLLLALPAALPVPALGLSSMLGVLVTLIGLQMLVGVRSMWLPRRFTRVRLRPDWCQRVARMGERFHLRVKRLVKPRINWMKYRLGISLLGLVVILLGLLMMLPISGTNTLPALVLLVLSFGLIETDGLLTLLAALVGLIVVVLYADIIYLLVSWMSN